MMDPNLPLTTDEYKEWGNPDNQTTYNYLKNYSPYHNIQKQDYPNMLFIGGTNDYQTPIWQIAKYVAKVKDNKTDQNTVLFSIDLEGGHMQNASGKEWIKKMSLHYSFIYANLFEQAKGK